MILHAKVPLDEVLEHRGTPAAGRIPGGLRPSCNQGGQLLALRFGQCAGASWRTLIGQTAHATPEKPVEVVTDGLFTQGQHLRDLAHGHTLGNGQQRMDTCDEA